LANTKQAEKRSKQSEKHRVRNVSKKSRMRTFIKKMIKALVDGNLKIAKERFIDVQSILDKYSLKGIIHKNKAARHKSRLNLKLKTLYDKKTVETDLNQ